MFLAPKREPGTAHKVCGRRGCIFAKRIYLLQRAKKKTLSFDKVFFSYIRLSASYIAKAVIFGLRPSDIRFASFIFLCLKASQQKRKEFPITLLVQYLKPVFFVLPKEIMQGC